MENLIGAGAGDVLTGNPGPNVIDGAGADQCTSDTRLVPGAPDAFLSCERTSVLTP